MGTYQLTYERVQEIIETQYIPKVLVLVAKEVKRAGETSTSKGDIIVRRARAVADAIVGGEDDADMEVQADTKSRKASGESDDDDDGEDAELQSMRGKKAEKATYDADDDDVAKDEEGDTIAMDEGDEEDEDTASAAPAEMLIPSPQRKKKGSGKESKSKAKAKAAASAAAATRRDRLLSQLTCTISLTPFGSRMRGDTRCLRRWCYACRLRSVKFL